LMHKVTRRSNGSAFWRSYRPRADGRGR
jgi:hypothetical protein